MKQQLSLKSTLIVLTLALGAWGCGEAPTQSKKSSGPNGSYVCGCGGDCTSTAGDGIADTWKTIGIDQNCDGLVDLDLGALGASPKHKDVFLQIDYMNLPSSLNAGDPTATLKPTQAAIDRLVRAFQNSPITNPDGTTGIHLHAYLGNEVPFHTVLTLDRSASSACAGNDFISLAAIKAQYLDSARALVFHYAVNAYDVTTPHNGALAGACPVDPTCGGHPSAGSTGNSQIGGTDFIVSFGAYWADAGSMDDTSDPTPHNHDYYDNLESATLMHELGHNFGLMHGGLGAPGNTIQECNTSKPNYLSIMNYLHQPNGGILVHSGGEVDHSGNHFLLDYSREILPPLNESSLNESAGVGSSDPNLMVLFMDLNGNEYVAESSGPVDWNHNGSIDGGNVSIDIDHDGDSTTVMVGGEDWSMLNYGFYSNQNPPVLHASGVGKTLVRSSVDVRIAE
jgi:hypothetical protein